MIDKMTESNRLTDLVQRLRGPIKHPQQFVNFSYEAADAIEALEAENEKLRAAFRVNMLRAFPSMLHDEIDAEIEAAIREGGNN